MKYTIVIPVYNRLNYLKITLATLREALRNEDENDVCVLICNFSDKLSKNLDEIQILKELRHEIVSDLKNVNVENSSMRSLSIALKKKSPYYLMLDSDGVCHPNLISGCDSVTSISGFMLGSVFNPHINSPVVGEINKDVKIKGNLSGLGMVIGEKMLTEFLGRWSNRKMRCGWDWRISGDCRDRSIPMYGTQNSFIEHIGYTGANSPQKENILPTQLARAINFLN